jgi:hypothetical protein
MKKFTPSVLLFHRSSSPFALLPDSYCAATGILQSSFALQITPGDDEEKSSTIAAGATSSGVTAKVTSGAPKRGAPGVSTAAPAPGD